MPQYFGIIERSGLEGNLKDHLVQSQLVLSYRHRMIYRHCPRLNPYFKKAFHDLSCCQDFFKAGGCRCDCSQSTAGAQWPNAVLEPRGAPGTQPGRELLASGAARGHRDRAARCSAVGARAGRRACLGRWGGSLVEAGCSRTGRVGRESCRQTCLHSAVSAPV